MRGKGLWLVAAGVGACVAWTLADDATYTRPDGNKMARVSFEASYMVGIMSLNDKFNKAVYRAATRWPDARGVCVTVVTPDLTDEYGHRLPPRTSHTFVPDSELEEVRKYRDASAYSNSYRQKRLEPECPK